MAEKAPVYEVIQQLGLTITPQQVQQIISTYYMNGRQAAETLLNSFNAKDSK